MQLKGLWTEGDAKSRAKKSGQARLAYVQRHNPQHPHHVNVSSRGRLTRDRTPQKAWTTENAQVSRTKKTASDQMTTSRSIAFTEQTEQLRDKARWRYSGPETKSAKWAVWLNWPAERVTCPSLSLYVAEREVCESETRQASLFTSPNNYTTFTAGKVGGWWWCQIRNKTASWKDSRICFMNGGKCLGIKEESAFWVIFSNNQKDIQDEKAKQKNSLSLWLSVRLSLVLSFNLCINSST